MATRTERPKLRHLTDREQVLGPAFLGPAVLYIIGMVAIPFVLAVAFSLSDVTVGDTTLEFVGLRNFRNVIRTPQFQRALFNSLLFTVVAQAIIIVLANVLAIVLSADFRGKWLVRLLILLPWATPISLGTIGWLWLLDSTLSPLDYVLEQINLLGPGTLFGPGRHMHFLGKEFLAMGSVIAVHVWRILPLATVILLAGLTSIDKDLLDQAEVDGASFWRILIKIKLPLVLPIMAIATLFGVIFIVTDMTVVWVLTRGGPVYYTQVLPVWAWFKGIDGGALAEGAAISLFLFPVLLAVAILMLRTIRRVEVA